jgi:hypothetical protein
MRADPFSRPQAGYYGGGYQAEPEPGLNDPGGVGVTRGNIRPRMTGGGAPMSRPGVPGMPMQTGGGAPMQPAQNTGIVPPHLQTGGGLPAIPGVGAMPMQAPSLPPSPMQFPQVGNPGLPPGAQLPPGGAVSPAPGFGSIEQMANPAYLQHLARLHALRGGY